MLPRIPARFMITSQRFLLASGSAPHAPAAFPLCRLWDVLWMASRAARRGGQEIRFQLYRVPRGGRGMRPRLVTLKVICGPGDEGEPVITIMLPGED